MAVLSDSPGLTASSPLGEGGGRLSSERRLVYFLVPLLAAAQLLGFGLLMVVNRKVSMNALDDQLGAGAQVFRAMTADRNASLEQTAASVARDYGLLYSVTHGARPTIDSALQNQLDRVGADVAVLTGRGGQVAGLAVPELVHGQGAYADLSDAALQRLAAGIPVGSSSIAPLQLDRANPVLYRWVKVALRTPTPTGYLTFGYAIDDDRAEQFAQMTNLHLVFLSRTGAGPWLVNATSFPMEVQRVMGYSFDSLPAGIFTYKSGGKAYRMVSVPLGNSGGTEVVAVVGKSVRNVMLPFLRLELVSGLLVLAGVVMSFFIVRRATRRFVAPLDEVVYQDGLTGLANRRLFELHQSLASHNLANLGRGYSLMLMDLNKFKAVNDTLGHAAGDEVLRETARRIGSVVRLSDTLARLGGDEFALLLVTEDRHKASEIAAKIVHSLRAPVQLADGRQACVGASIGIVRAPDDGSDAHELMQLADKAMYTAKRSGCGFVFAGEVAGAMVDEVASEAPDLPLLSDARPAQLPAVQA